MRKNDFLAETASVSIQRRPAWSEAQASHCRTQECACASHVRCTQAHAHTKRVPREVSQISHMLQLSNSWANCVEIWYVRGTNNIDTS